MPLHHSHQNHHHHHDDHDHEHHHHDHDHEHHHHDHDHEHHHHDHDHEHHKHDDDHELKQHEHSYTKQSDLTFQEKMVKLFNHWIKHNEDHAKTYREWADQIEKNKLSKVSDLLKEAAEDTKAINRKFEAAVSLISKS